MEAEMVFIRMIRWRFDGNGKEWIDLIAAGKGKGLVRLMDDTDFGFDFSFAVEGFGCHRIGFLLDSGSFCGL